MVIIHSDPVKNCGSSLERCARSGTGANFAPGPVSGVGTMCTTSTSLAGAAYFDLRHARNHRRRADRHQQLVRAGLAFVENVGTAHVRERAGGGQQQQT